MSHSYNNESWEISLADTNKKVVIFPLAELDTILALDIERALERYFEHLGIIGRKRHIFLMSGWLPNPSLEQFQRIRRLGEKLKKNPDLGLWILASEKSADDIHHYAPEPLYITGKLMSMGIPAFEPEMGKAKVERALKQMTGKRLAAWAEMLSRIGSGPVNLSHWRHDIRGRILGTININLQLSEKDFMEILRSDDMAINIGLWSDLVRTRPYCEQHPKVARAAIELLNLIDEFRKNPADALAETQKRLELCAKEVEEALDDAKKIRAVNEGKI
jgi:hypothetical protein